MRATSRKALFAPTAKVMFAVFSIMLPLAITFVAKALDGDEINYCDELVNYCAGSALVCAATSLIVESLSWFVLDCGKEIKKVDVFVGLISPLIIYLITIFMGMLSINQGTRAIPLEAAIIAIVANVCLIGNIEIIRNRVAPRNKEAE